LAFGLFSFRDNGLALAALALVIFGAIKCPPFPSRRTKEEYGAALGLPIFPRIAVFL